MERKFPQIRIDFNAPLRLLSSMLPIATRHAVVVELVDTLA